VTQGVSSTEIKVGIAGMGAIGRAVARALVKGIDGFTLVAASDLHPSDEFKLPYVSLKELSKRCDLIIECLPPAAVPELARDVFTQQKNLVLISSCALLMFPEILDIHKSSTSRIFVPSGALAGMDGVKAMREMGIQKCKIASTKHPRGFSTAPFVVVHNVDLENIETKTKIFAGNALEAAKGFPANVNVAATLSIASGVGAENTHVEIWADPAAKGNAHEIYVETAYSQLQTRIENLPDPTNPKSSVLAAQSIVALLRNMNSTIALL
jgi:aspartate dehydrogenase